MSRFLAVDPSRITIKIRDYEVRRFIELNLVSHLLVTALLHSSQKPRSTGNHLDSTSDSTSLVASTALAKVPWIFVSVKAQGRSHQTLSLRLLRPKELTYSIQTPNVSATMYDYGDYASYHHTSHRPSTSGLFASFVREASGVVEGRRKKRGDVVRPQRVRAARCCTWLNTTVDAVERRRWALIIGQIRGNIKRMRQPKRGHALDNERDEYVADRPRDEHRLPRFITTTTKNEQSGDQPRVIKKRNISGKCTQHATPKTPPVQCSITTPYTTRMRRRARANSAGHTKIAGAYRCRRTVAKTPARPRHLGDGEGEGAPDEHPSLECRARMKQKPNSQEMPRPGANSSHPARHQSAEAPSRVLSREDADAGTAAAGAGARGRDDARGIRSPRGGVAQSQSQIQPCQNRSSSAAWVEIRGGGGGGGGGGGARKNSAQRTFLVADHAAPGVRVENVRDHIPPLPMRGGGSGTPGTALCSILALSERKLAALLERKRKADRGRINGGAFTWHGRSSASPLLPFAVASLCLSAPASTHSRSGSLNYPVPQPTSLDWLGTSPFRHQIHAALRELTNLKHSTEDARRRGSAGLQSNARKAKLQLHDTTSDLITPLEASLPLSTSLLPLCLKAKPTLLLLSLLFKIFLLLSYLRAYQALILPPRTQNGHSLFAEVYSQSRTDKKPANQLTAKFRWPLISEFVHGYTRYPDALALSGAFNRYVGNLNDSFTKFKTGSNSYFKSSNLKARNRCEALIILQGLATSQQKQSNSNCTTRSSNDAAEVGCTVRSSNVTVESRKSTEAWRH
ncbi:hypothetical protein B0H17DRAFT_1275622 [Mycena rosella]|uniref:Uncharacterized protein n=1 Tax=Mycena rosella TaxID=1033263 RepID=A0AAD7C6K7_MYCRO|nr:hypothetical protein B0H17DRAFT_1275622 [Mycena rosella]